MVAPALGKADRRLLHPVAIPAPSALLLLSRVTMPLESSEDGEAANTELGLLLGLTGRLLSGPLAERLPGA